MTALTLVGLLGWPVGHSVSPAMHNAAFRSLGLRWLYLPLPVHPDNLAAAVAGLRALGFAGVNVTIPHKVAVCGLVDELSDAARAIGAVNTIVFAGGRSLGHNTDAGGFLTALTAAGFAPRGATAFVLGAGGSARAVAYALGTAGAEVIIWNRTFDRAKALATALEGHLPSGALSVIESSGDMAVALERAGLLVNCTSVGMTGGPPGSPLPQGLNPRRGTTVFDLVYTPRLTPLLRQARAAGARPVGGLSMLVHQGAQALALWTGQEPPLLIMERAAQRALARRGG